MLINATLRTDKSKLLQNRYIELINSGVSPDEILVLCLNSYKKQDFLKKIEESVTAPILGKYNIYTFLGLCYNAVADNWAVIEQSIKSGDAKICPNLCGLELSETLLAQSIKRGNFKDYFSKTNLIHQLFKRMQLTVLNGLSDEEIARKSAILGESFFDDAIESYDIFRRLTLKYRSFDYLRQLSMLPFIVEKTDYFKNIKYLFIDDADEITYAELKFIMALKPSLTDWVIAYDGDGSSRCGYLSAYKTAVFSFEKIFGEKPTHLPDDNSSKDAYLLYKNITEDKKTLIQNMSIQSSVKRLDMLDEAFLQIRGLLKSNVKPSEIVIITPVIDEMLNSFVCANNFDIQTISGSRKPKDSEFLRNCLTFLKLVNYEWDLKIDLADLRFLFFDCLEIPMKYSQKSISLCLQEKKVVDFDFKNIKYQKNYDEFKNLVAEISCKKSSLVNQLLAFFNYYTKKGVSKSNLKAFNFFIKEVRSFEEAGLDAGNEKNIVIQFENGIISENPSVAEEIDENAMIIATPQKVIDFEVRRKYQIWLDISNDLWTMRDIGVLYNAWVFNAEWSDKEFTFEDNVRLSKEKHARVLRKLLMCCDKKVFAFYSQYDSSGYENFGNLASYFLLDTKTETNKKPWCIVPREDQKDIVLYNGGKAAVNAVPGAGKTTILIALLINLLKQGVLPENIFVLTYMESAASNIREKIKSAMPDLTELPNVSTIHGLAFRLIKENNNYTKLNLPDNIQVIDENTKQKLLRECISALNLNHDDYDDYFRGIAVVKLSPNGILPLKNFKNTIHFDKLYALYEQNMRKLGYIDYDDMLRYAVKLIDENADLKQHYSEICHFMIEDEAQDSSELQQKLLLLLSSKHNNLLRIGDINQAITSSFTDSDPKCFRNYFESCKKMVMKTSQRSAVQIQQIANDLIKFSQREPFLQGAFFDSPLLPAGANPVTEKTPEFRVFEDMSSEKYFILNKIKQIFKTNANKSIAILLRNNYQISEWASFLSDNGMKVVLRTDILEQKTVYKLIIAFLEFLQFPFSNKSVTKLMKVFNDSHIINFSKADFLYMEGLKEPFIQTNKNDLSENLEHLWWELQFNDELSYHSLDVAVVKIGLKYFSTSNEKSNIYLISTIIKRLMGNYSNQETVLEKLQQIAKRPIGSSYNFFEDENVQSVQEIRLMTVHKSKGDEFDIVFIPEMSEDNYGLTEKKIKIKSNFVEKVKEIRNGYTKKTPLELKKEVAEESIRLLYVAFTRAKEELYVSCALKGKYNKPNTLSYLFDNFRKAER